MLGGVLNFKEIANDWKMRIEFVAFQDFYDFFFRFFYETFVNFYHFYETFKNNFLTFKNVEVPTSDHRMKLSLN